MKNSYYCPIPLSLLCSAWVRHCRHSLVEVVDCCVSRWQSWTALGPFWWQAVQGVCWGATHLLSVSESYLTPLPSGSVLAACLSAQFPACWRQTNVTPIPKSPPSSSVANYRPISITSILPKVFERLVSVCLGRFMERSGVLPTSQFAYRKALGICDALLCMSHTLQNALESGQEAKIMQIDFSAAFDRVHHQGILYWLCSVGIGGSVLFIFTPFLSYRSPRYGGWLLE